MTRDDFMKALDVIGAQAGGKTFDLIVHTTFGMVHGTWMGISKSLICIAMVEGNVEMQTFIPYDQIVGVAYREIK